MAKTVAGEVQGDDHKRTTDDSREEVWPLLSITKTNLEKGLRKLRRGDLLELVMPAAKSKVSERIDIRKVNP